MERKEYGITTIKLILTIVVIIIVFCGGFLLLNKLWKTNNIKNIKTDLLYIQAICKFHKDKHILNEKDELLGENISEYNNNEKVNEIISESNSWYVLSQEDLEEIGKGELNSEDGYIFNYDTEDLIYAKGIKEEENVFYKLSDIVEEDDKKIQIND